MITLRLNRHHEEFENVKKLVEKIKRNPGSCDEVWLSTLYGTPPLEKHRELAGKYQKIADYFTENGIKVSLQIANTLGHGHHIEASEDCTGLVYPGSPVENMVDADGTIATHCFCFYGQHFREYLKQSILCYQGINISDVWVDDDLRVVMHSPAVYTCFCDNCIARFNKTYQTNFTREQLAYEINYGDIIWRERYMEQNRQGIYEVVELITTTAMEIAPNARMGYEYCRAYNYIGMDYKYIFEPMHNISGKTVRSRPGGGYYNDKEPMGMLDNVLVIHRANAVAPDYVTDRYPEIENISNVTFGKSLEGTCKEASFNLAFGCNGLTFAALNSGFESSEDYDEKLLSWLSKYRPYWDALVSHNENTTHGSVAVYESQNAWKKNLSKEDEPFSWINIIGLHHIDLWKIGLPLSHEQQNAKVLLLYPEAVDYMTDDDIRELLKKPVLTDAGAVSKIIERGFGDCFQATVEKLEDIAVSECFTNHPVNTQSPEGTEWKASFFNSHGFVQTYQIHPKDSSTEIFGVLKNKIQNIDYDATNVILKTYDEKGNEQASWAVFGYSLWEHILSSDKRNQILNAADYICQNTLPAKLVSPEQVVVIPKVTQNGKTASVSLQSISIGTTDKLTLLIRNPQSENFRLIGAYHDETLSFVKQGNGYILELPALSSWDMMTVLC